MFWISRKNCTISKVSLVLIFRTWFYCKRGRFHCVSLMRARETFIMYDAAGRARGQVTLSLARRQIDHWGTGLRNDGCVWDVKNMHHRRQNTSTVPLLPPPHIPPPLSFLSLLLPGTHIPLPFFSLPQTFLHLLSPLSFLYLPKKPMTCFCSVSFILMFLFLYPPPPSH